MKLFPSEEFKKISLGEDDAKLKLSYAISNYGRLISFQDNMEEGTLVKGSKQDGYRIWRYRILQEKGKAKYKYKHRFLYKLVAEYFIPKTSDEQTYVLHLDRNRANDHVQNLKWATRAEMLEHSKNSPYVIEAKKKQVKLLASFRGNSKLTETKVMLLKKRLLNPNRKTRLKIIAKEFGVTEMQLHRIKTGENWGHIKV